ncbi:hypothetical protein TNCV_248191 [Trichonephila clavipes]|nr:hypothetical protein TNCV_248191 [Trichonephila clavipes]
MGHHFGNVERQIHDVIERCWFAVLFDLATFGTATAGSDVVQSDVQFSMTFSNICGRISAITRRMLSSKWSAFEAYPHRPMTLHSPTENSLAVLNHKILDSNSQVQNVKLCGHQTCLNKSIVARAV